MMRVSNRRSVLRLAWRSFKANRIRNLFAVMAMILTTILFTSLFTAFEGLKNSTEQLLLREYGTSAHGTIYSLTKEQVKQLATNPLVKSYGTNLDLSLLDKDKFAVRKAEIGYYDDNGARMSYCYPSSGRLPKEKYELATETTVLEKLGIPPVLGTDVTISYPLGKNNITQTFKLCGFWKSDQAAPYSKIILSEQYVSDQLEIYKDQLKSDIKQNWNLQLTFDSSLNAESKLRQIAAENGYQVDDDKKSNFLSVHPNMGYLSQQMNRDNSLLYCGIIIVLIILFTGYLIIYNIFHISITGDIRFYGLLKTIGATGKQMKRMIRYQALLLCLIGMPIGLLLGYVSGLCIAPLFMTSFHYNSYQKIEPLIFIGAAFFTILTVLISIRKPSKVAAKVSPVEAIRYSEGILKRKKTTKNTRRGSRIYRMAMSNLLRNKKKTILVFVSLSLSIVLLNLVDVFSKGFDVEKMISRMTTADYTIGSVNYFDSKYNQANDGVSENMIDEMRKQSGIQGSGFVYYDTIPVIVDFSQKMIDYYFRGMQKADIDQLLSMYQVEESPTRQWQIQLYGMDDFILKKLKVVEGTLDLEKFKTGNYIIQAVEEADDYGNIDWNSAAYRAGDKVTVRYIDEMPSSEQGKIKYHSKTYKVMAVVILKNSWNVRYYSSTSMLLPSVRFIKDTGVKTPMICLADVEDRSENSMDQFLKNYTDNIDSDMSFESKTSLISMFKEYRDAFVVVGNALSILVGLIGILNFINVMMTGIISRKREFASLKSIGMTGKQTIFLLVLEGLFYSGITLLLSAAISSLLNITLVNTLSKNIWFFTARFSLLTLILVAPILLLISVVVPYVSYRIMNKKSVVEQLRTLE